MYLCVIVIEQTITVYNLFNPYRTVEGLQFTYPDIPTTKTLVQIIPSYLSLFMEIGASTV